MALEPLAWPREAWPKGSEQRSDSFFLQETTIASPVILRVDPKGYYLYWTYQSKVRWPLLFELLPYPLSPARLPMVQGGGMDAGEGVDNGLE